MSKTKLNVSSYISRRDYQEILLAKMAGGDLYANETLLKLRRVDMLLDKIRERPLYQQKEGADR